MSTSKQQDVLSDQETEHGQGATSEQRYIPSLFGRSKNDQRADALRIGCSTQKTEICLEHPNDVIHLSGIQLSILELSLLNKGLNFAPFENFKLFDTIIDLQCFVRKLVLHFFFLREDSIDHGGTHNNTPELLDRADQVYPDLPSLNSNACELTSFRELCALQDMNSLLDEQHTDEDADYISSFLVGSRDSGLKNKSIFYPTYINGPHIATFEKLVERDLHLLAQKYCYKKC
ncbi:hypothetical protein FKM82_006928 [Ascaphus truei]